jgi:hypothetical protein
VVLGKEEKKHTHTHIQNITISLIKKNLKNLKKVCKVFTGGAAGDPK